MTPDEREGQERLTNIAVIIPALNAAALLPATLAALGAVGGIIVVDGGSTDQTPRIAASLGATVIHAARGRGGQIAAGVAASTRPWLLILHADTRLAPGWRAAATGHMARHPDRAGYFRFALHSADPRARRMERIVAWRCRRLALPYGDQGLLIPRGLLASAGGMRPLPLMEDVDLVRRIGRRRLAPIAADAVTSAARYERDGWLRRPARNLLCLSLYLAGVPARIVARIYG